MGRRDPERLRTGILHGALAQAKKLNRKVSDPNVVLQEMALIVDAEPHFRAQFRGADVCPELEEFLRRART